MGLGCGVLRCGQVHCELVVLSRAYVSLAEGGVSVASRVWLGHATCVEGLTCSGKVLCDHTQRYAGLPAQKEFV